MYRLIQTVLIFLCIAVSAQAQTSKEEQKLREEASTAFESERFAQAYPVYSQLVSLYPKDADLNFRFGTCALYAGVEKEKAIRHLEFAVKKGCDDVRVYFYLGKAYHLNYDFTQATKNYRAYLEKLDPKVKDPLPAEQHIRMCDQGRQLLANIKDVVVLERTNAAAADFYRYYNLEEIGGRVLSTPEELLSKYDKKAELVSVMHFPGNALTIFFTSYGKDGTNGKDIYRAQILPGGQFSEPERLPSTVNTPYDEDYAFMHPDGKTFYFASKGHNSMGGYDIFRCMYDRNTDSFSSPVNLDFAINTPDDDIFYVVDSLKETAYFASSRNASQNEMNVYKVMVKSLPVNLTFIAGDYFADAEGLGTKARLKIIDEMTGKPITEAVASIGEKGYLLDLPKAGKYRIEVKAEESAVTHSGSFEIPDLGRTVAFHQELRIVDEDGQEKLIITNDFGTPLDEDIAALSAEALRRKSGLDVNVTDEILEQLDKEESLREDITEERLAAIAGFSADRDLDSIVEEMQSEADGADDLIPQVKAHAGELLVSADESTRKAERLTASADSLMKTVTEEDGNLYVRTVIAYNEMLTAAKDHRRDAANALAVAEALNTSSIELQTNAEDLHERNEQLEKALETEDLEVALSILETYRRELGQPETELPAVTATRALADERNAQQLSLNQRLGELRSERDQLDARRRRKEIEAESAKRKDLDALRAEISELNAQIERIDEEIVSKASKIEVLGNEERDQLARLELFENAMATEASSDTKFDVARAEELKSRIDASGDRIASMEINDPETLALVDEEMKATRNDIVVMEGISAQAIAMNVDLKPVSGLRLDFDMAIKRIETDAIAPVQQRDALVSLELDQVRDQIAFMRSMNVDALSAEERRQRDSELNAALSYRDELLAQEGRSKTVEAASQEDATSILAVVLPQSQMELEKGSPGNDTEAWLVNTAALTSVAGDIAERIRMNEQAIMKSDDAAEVAALSAESEKLYAVRSFIDQEMDEESLKVAYEEDLRAIIDSESDFAERTRSQITKTENYIDALEAIEAHKMGDMSDREWSDINEEIKSAQSKLENYRADLELSVSVDDPEPEATAADETPEVVVVPALPSTDEGLMRSIGAFDNDHNVTNGRIDEEIARRVEAIDSAQSDEDRERLQMEISRLEDMRENLEVPAEDSNTVDQPMVETTVEVATIEDLAEALIPVEIITGDDVSSHPIKEELEASLLADEGYMKTAAQIEEGEAQIEALNLELEAAEKDSKKKKIDRQIEKEFFEVADARVDRSRRLSEEANDAFSENERIIEQVVNDGQLGESEVLSSHIRSQLRKAEMNMEDARSIRVSAAPEIDDIKQAYQYESALALELEALAIQQRLMEIIDNKDALLALDDEMLEDVLAGDYVSETEELVAEIDQIVEPTVEAEETVQEPASGEDDLEEETAEELELEGELEADTVPAVTDNTAVTAARASELINEARANVSEFPEVEIITEGNGTEDLPIAARFVNEISAGEGTDVRDAILKNEDYRSYAAAREELLALEAKRMSILESRNAAVGDLNDLQGRIAKMEMAIRTADDVAEQEGLAEELKALYRNAEVRYSEVLDADERLALADAELEQKAAEVRQMYVMLDAAEIVAEAKASLPEPIKPGELAVNPPAPAMVLSNFLFAYPRVLTTNIFGFTDAAAYSDATPIPMNPALPEGVIFKVQVGAFRNPIPQDHFGKFAPLAGEELNNGITRYTAGLFLTFDNADDAKKMIREMGYSDAFVVAFRDGKRISLAEARQETIDVQGAPVVMNAPSNATSGEAASATANNTSSTTNVGRTTAPALEVPEFATEWAKMEGSFYSVQIGVYSKQVALEDLFGMSDVMAERTAGGFIRYTSGAFDDLASAEARKAQARANGIKDAFIVAYIDGKKVAVSTLRQRGSIQPQQQPSSQASQSETQTEVTKPASYTVRIGSFEGEVPSSTALAMLMLEAKWGIYQTREGNVTTYWTRELRSETDVDRVKSDFAEYEVTIADVVTK